MHTEPEASPEVSLRPVRREDLERVRAWRNDRELADLIKSSPGPYSAEDMARWLDRNQGDPNQFFQGIYAGQTLVGIARLMFIDREHGTAELGIYLGDRESRGRGYGRQGLSLLLARGFDELRLRRIFLKVSEKNLAAIRLYECSGFTREGVMREHYLENGKPEGAVIFGILATEFGRERR